MTSLILRSWKRVSKPRTIWQSARKRGWKCPPSRPRISTMMRTNGKRSFTKPSCKSNRAVQLIGTVFHHTRTTLALDPVYHEHRGNSANTPNHYLTLYMTYSLSLPACNFLYRDLRIHAAKCTKRIDPYVQHQYALLTSSRCRALQPRK